MTFPLFPEQASLGAREVDYVMLWLIGISCFFLLVTAGPIAFFCFRYRRGNQVNRVHIRKGALALEFTWTIIPIFVALGLFGLGASAYFRQRHPPEEAMELHVVGKQWMWKIQHPEGKREINELHLPEGVAVKLLMTSEDVIHSFFVPSFRVKQDVLPGRYTTIWMVPSKPGSYHLFCAEFCGTSHSRMIGRVTIMPRAEYQAWLLTGEQGESPVAAGARLFRELGCTGCHVGSPAVHAPNLNGLFGSVVPLEGGTTTLADERYLRDSIMLPNLQIVHGYEALMPSYQGKVSEEELMAVITYLKTLGSGKRGERIGGPGSAGAVEAGGEAARVQPLHLDMRTPAPAVVQPDGAPAAGGPAKGGTPP
ncbi:MAG TPA: cytochrome c oxidase subunit II [Chthoniobacteraceae bacterium]|nr:cytochrome c oxidase subunit II [Chthoniobacteraceae bacterium]